MGFYRAILTPFTDDRQVHGVSPVPTNATGTTRFFYGSESSVRWPLERCYRIYVDPAKIRCAYVGAPRKTIEEAANHGGTLGLFTKWLAARMNKKRREREALYDTLEPSHAALVDSDR